MPEKKVNQNPESSLAASSGSSATSNALVFDQGITELMDSVDPGIRKKHGALFEALAKLSTYDNRKKYNEDNAKLNVEIIKELFNHALAHNADLTTLGIEDYVDYDKTTEHTITFNSQDFIVKNNPLVKLMTGLVNAILFSSKSVSNHVNPEPGRDTGDFIGFFHQYGDRVRLFTTEGYFSKNPDQYIKDWKALMGRLYHGSNVLQVDFDENEFNNNQIIGDNLTLLDEVTTKTGKYVQNVSARYVSLIADFQNEYPEYTTELNEIEGTKAKYHYVEKRVLQQLAQKLSVSIDTDENSPEYTTQLEEAIRMKAEELTHRVINEVHSLPVAELRAKPLNEETRRKISLLSRCFENYYDVNRKVFHGKTRDGEKGYCFQKRLKQSQAEIFTLIDDGQPNIVSFTVTALANGKLPFPFLKQNINNSAGPREYAIFNVTQASIIKELRTAFLDKNKRNFNKAIKRLEVFNHLFVTHYENPKLMTDKMVEQLEPSSVEIEEAMDALPDDYVKAGQINDVRQLEDQQQLDRINELNTNISSNGSFKFIPFIRVNKSTTAEFEELVKIANQNSPLANYYLATLYRDGLAIEGRKRLKSEKKAFERLCRAMDFAYNKTYLETFNEAIKSCYIDSQELTSEHCLSLASMAENGLGYYSQKNIHDAYNLLCLAVIRAGDQQQTDIALKKLTKFQDKYGLDTILTTSVSYTSITKDRMSADYLIRQNEKEAEEKSSPELCAAFVEIYKLRLKHFEKNPNENQRELALKALRRYKDIYWNAVRSSTQASSSTSSQSPMDYLDQIFTGKATITKDKIWDNLRNKNIHNINKQDVNGNSLLHHMAKIGDGDILRMLVKHINYNLRNDDGKQAFEIALEYTGDVKKRNDCIAGLSLIHAQNIGNKENKELFLSIFNDDFFSGIDENFTKNPLYKNLFEVLQKPYCSISDLKDIARKMPKDGESRIDQLFNIISQSDSIKDLNKNIVKLKLQDLLHQDSVPPGQYSNAVNAFVYVGGDPGLKVDDKDNGLLHFAVQKGDAGLVKTLFSTNINILAKNSDQKTVFDLALEQEEDNSRMIEVILKETKEFFMKRNDDRSSLFNALFEDKFFMFNVTELKTSAMMKQLFLNLVNHASLDEMKKDLELITPQNEDHIRLKEKLLQAETMEAAAEAVKELKISKGREFLATFKTAKDSMASASSGNTSLFVERKNNDIYEYPSDKVLPQGLISIGDLHGNAVKLLHFLINHSVVDFKESPEQNYAEFVKLYQQMEALLSVKKHSGIDASDISNTELVEQLEANIKEFNELVQKLEIKNGDTWIHLIGDELADRGANDYYVLKLLDVLKKNEVNLSINISNHSNDFIKFYESFKGDDIPPVQTGGLVIHQKPSIARLAFLLETEIVSKDELVQLVESSYKSGIKAIEYNITETGIQIYTHAPVSFAVIEHLAKKMNVDYDDSTKESLGKTIDKINEKIQTLVSHNQLSSEFTDGDFGADKRNDVMSSHPLTYIAWNRWDDAQEQQELRPDQHREYSITYLHGHDIYKSQQQHVINMDTESGKTNSVEISEQKTAIANLPSQLLPRLKSISADFNLTTDIATKLIKLAERFKASNQRSGDQAQVGKIEREEIFEEVKSIFGRANQLTPTLFNEIMNAFVAINDYINMQEVSQTTRFLNVPRADTPQLAAAASSSSSSYSNVVSKLAPHAPQTSQPKISELLINHYAVKRYIENKFGNDQEQRPKEINDLLATTHFAIDRIQQKENIDIKKLETEIEKALNKIEIIPEEAVKSYKEFREAKDKITQDISEEALSEYKDKKDNFEQVMKEYPLLVESVKIKQALEATSQAASSESSSSLEMRNTLHR